MMSLPSRDTDERRPALTVFEDPRSRQLLEAVRRIARTDACALLLGESGTGQDLIARTLHAASARAAEPFVSVNCGAFPNGQLESELFGYEKGAMAGAFAATPGWLEAANGGSIFLDEIERLPMHLQARLVQVMRDRQSVRIGARRALPADVRVVAATATDLEQAVREGRFRQDLYHALRAAHLEVPPLRQRPGDILPLARHFLATVCERLRYPPARFSATAEARLLAHAWPGNLRELENVVHRALLMSAGGEIGADALSLSELPAGGASPATEPDEVESAFEVLDDALRRLCEVAPAELFARVERAAIGTAWRHCHLNQLQAARLLGISRNVLRARLIAWGDIDARR